MRAETLKGHLDGILLAVLEPEPRHGYAIMEALRVRSGGQVDLPTGTVYPALHRLEKQKWIAAAWKISENNQRAKYYRLTATGKRQLTKERSKWAQLSDAIAGVLHPEQR